MTLAGRQFFPLFSAAGLDDHGPFQAEEGVGDVAVVVPGHGLARRQGENDHFQFGSLGHHLPALDFVVRLFRHGFLPVAADFCLRRWGALSRWPAPRRGARARRLFYPDISQMEFQK